MMTLESPRYRPHSANLDCYFRDLQEEQSLDISEEHELAELVAEGDFEAREKLARANLRLVVTIARQYTSRKIGLDDLIEEGNLGLLRAVETFDPSRGTRFSTYAAYWIRQSIRRGMMNSEATIRLPYYAMQMLFEWRRASEKLQSECGRTPEEREIAEELNWVPRQVAIIRRVLRVIKGNFQSEAPESNHLNDVVDSREATPGLLGDADPEMVARVLQLVKSLPEREAQVLTHRYGLDGGRILTLQEVGEKLGLTKARISQIEKTALCKLRQILQHEAE